MEDAAKAYNSYMEARVRARTRLVPAPSPFSSGARARSTPASCVSARDARPPMSPRDLGRRAAGRARCPTHSLP